MNRDGRNLARWEATVSAVVQATLRPGDDYYRAVSKVLARSLGVDLCFATELVRREPLRARTLAFWNRDQFLENFEYDLKDTPCEEVAQGGSVCHGRDIQDLFPDDQDLVDLAVESYAAVPMLDAGKQVMGHLAVLHSESFEAKQIDLTLLRMIAQLISAEMARRRATRRLEQRERLLHQVIDLTPHMVFAKDLEGRFLLANRALAESFGVGVEEVIGRRDTEFFGEEEAERLRRDDLRVLSSGRRLDLIEDRFVSSTGRVRSLSTSKIPFDAAGTGQSAVLGIAVDVTDQVRAEQRLRSLVEATAPTTGEEFFATLVAQLADLLSARWAVLGELGSASQVHGLAFWSGERHEAAFDYELAGTPCAEVVATGAQFEVTHGVGNRYSDHSWLASLGAEHYLGTPLTGIDGEVIGALVVLNDSPKTIEREDRRLLELFAARAAAELRRQRAENRQRELQAQVLHVQKLESLGVLAGGIAHDFNNLLATILGNVGLALMQAPEDDGELRRCLQEIELAAERSGELTRQMLAYSGKGRTVVEALQMQSVIEEMGELLRSSVSKKAHLEIDIEPSLASIDGDPVQVRQLVLNLITNAAEALGGGSGRVRVSAFAAQPPKELDRLGGLVRGPSVCLEVRDDGCGMDEETLERLFDPFYSTKRTGRGLGMATVHGVVRRHRAAITVESKPSVGTAIRVYFPCSRDQADPEQHQPTRSEDAPPQSGTLLVVDDEEAVLRTASSILRHRGFEVLEASSGRRAIELFRDHEEVDLVLLDLTMPDLDGLETLAELRKQRPARVILTSGFSEHDVSAAEVDGFLEKPYRPARLLEVIGQALPAGGHRA